MREASKWNKSFPIAFCKETNLEANGYQLYQRHHAVIDRPIIRHPSNCNIEVTLDNNLVVPYNLYLSKNYKAHIDVEMCGGIQAVKYIHSYV